MNSNPNLSELSSGKTVGGGRYILNKHVGESATVWLAHDEIENKPVVLNFLPSELNQDPRALEELRGQVNTLRNLSHPNIGNIYELYEAPGEEPFISSEYVEGMNLHALQQMQPGKVFSWTFLVPLLKQVFAALQYVHENNLVQGSLKPSNLMLDRNGKIKLLDPGIAGILNNPLYVGPAQATSGGLLLYLSPQQIDGNPPAVSDDIYSLGITVYEFLTGTVPFNQGDILPQIRSAVPQTIEQRLAQLRVTNPIPPIISSMIAACLAKEPGSRPQNVETLSRSLEVAEATPQEVAKPAAAKVETRTHAPAAAASVAAPSATPYQVPTPAPAPRKKPVALMAVAAVAVLAVAGGAIFFLKSGKDDAATPSVSTPVANTDSKSAQPNKTTQQNSSASVSPTPSQVDAPLNSEEEAKLRRKVKEAIELGELAARSKSKSSSPSPAPVRSTSPTSSVSSSKPGDFMALFQGDDLEGWKGDEKFWSVSDGVVTGQTPPGAPKGLNTCLIWQGGTVGDFELRFLYKFKMTKANETAVAGVVYRGQKRGDMDVWGYECRLTLRGDNIGGLHSRERMGMMSYNQQIVVKSGPQGIDQIQALGDLLTPAEYSKVSKREDWNECVITARDNHFVHTINGRVVADLTDENERKQKTSGLLALEINTGATPAVFVQFKDVQLKRLTR